MLLEICDLKEAEIETVSGGNDLLPTDFWKRFWIPIWDPNAPEMPEGLG